MESSTITEGVPDLSGRERAILRAVGAGRAELVAGPGADLYLDGRCCCDQAAAYRLVRAGLIAPTAGSGRVAAVLTAAGHARLETSANVVDIATAPSAVARAAAGSGPLRQAM